MRRNDERARANERANEQGHEHRHEPDHQRELEHGMGNVEGASGFPDTRSVDGSTDNAPRGERLQKVMAAAGVASRRVCEQYIAEGRVAVNGEVVMEPGRRVDPTTDRVTLDGTALQLDTTKRYLMLNKPVGVVSSMSDEQGRPDLTRFTAGYEERLFNVGRLDQATSGLLVLTNDGELAHVLAHPSFGVTKTYVARVDGEVSPATIKRLLDGIELDDGPITADKARVLAGSTHGESLVELTLHSGRNRIVRRMLDAVGHPVKALVRRQFGPLHLGTLREGQLRELNKAELGALLTLARDPETAARRERRAARNRPKQKPGKVDERRDGGRERASAGERSGATRRDGKPDAKSGGRESAKVKSAKRQASAGGRQSKSAQPRTGQSRAGQSGTGSQSRSGQARTSQPRSNQKRGRQQ